MHAHLSFFPLSCRIYHPSVRYSLRISWTNLTPALAVRFRLCIAMKHSFCSLSIITLSLSLSSIPIPNEIPYTPHACHTSMMMHHPNLIKCTKENEQPCGGCLRGNVRHRLSKNRR